MIRLLPFREIGNGPIVVMLHGLYAYGRTWMKIARDLSEHYRVILPDLRNHGQAFHSAEMNYHVMAQDVAELCQHLNAGPVRLLGHSMGGKVAMRLALDQPQWVSHLVIVDIALAAYPSAYHQQLIKAMQTLDLSQIRQRQEADVHLEAFIPEVTVRQFLLSNLQKSGENWVWQFNLPVLSDAIETLLAPLETVQQSFSGPTLSLRGSRSDYVKDADLHHLQSVFPRLQAVSVPEAGHWLQHDQPDRCVKALLDFWL